MYSEQSAGLLVTRAAAAVVLLFIFIATLASADKVYILNMMDPNFKLNTDKIAANAKQQGFMTSFNLYGTSVADGNEVVFLTPASNATPLQSAIDAAAAEYPTLLAVIGLDSYTDTVKAMGSDSVKNNNIVLISPGTIRQSVRTWNPNLLFTLAETDLCLFALIDHIVNRLMVRRVGYMYTTGAVVGQAEVDEVTEKLLNAGYAAPAMYYRHIGETKVDEAAYETFVAAAPQAIIVNGFPSNQMNAFLQRVMTDSRLNGTYLLYMRFLQNSIERAVRNTGYNPTPTQFISAFSTHPIVNSSSEDYIHTYLSELAEIQRLGLATVTDDQMISSMDTQVTMLESWIAGHVTRMSLMVPGATKSPAAYQTSIYSQRSYLVGGDYLLSRFAGPCDGMVDTQAPLCECNQANHAVFVQYLHSDGTLHLRDDPTFTIPMSSCYSRNLNVTMPVNLLNIRVVDDDYDLLVSTVFDAPVQAALAWQKKNSNSVFQLNRLVMNTTAEKRAVDASRFIEDYLVSLILGFVSRAAVTAQTLVFDPMFSHPIPRVTDRNYVMLMPTAEQQVYLLGYLMKNWPSKFPVTKKMNMVMINIEQDDVQTFMQLAHDTLAHFDIPFNRTEDALALPADASLDSALSSEGITAILGIRKTDIPVITAHLKKNKRAAVLAAYGDFAILYDDLVAAFKPLSESVRSRFITMTNLPLWSDTSDAAHEESPFLKEFHEAVPDPALHTPVGMQSFLDIYLLNSLSSSISSGVPSSELFINAIYQQTTLVAGELTFGPFYDCDDSISSSSSSSSSGSSVSSISSISSSASSSGGASQSSNQAAADAQRSRVDRAAAPTPTSANFGATYIGAVSMARVLDPRVSMTTARITPGMDYSLPPPGKGAKGGGLSNSATTGIIVGCVVGALIVAVVIFLLVYCCSCSPSTGTSKNAPKEPTEPVTVMFTDIESSTALWAAVPQLMPEAVATHHKLIRQLIKKYKCYEVKTIGDSFMIACKDPYSAAQLARDVQLKLLKYDWGTTEIESSYRTFEMRARDTKEDYEPPTAMLSSEEYKALWNGLRVRIGVHTGLSDIRQDEQTMRYDYYGDTSNMAARTEAIGNGGQVLLTESTYWALSHAERTELQCVSLGPQGLRGVPYSVEMFQLNAVPGRKHAALRTEIEAILPDDGADDTEGTNSHFTSTEAMLSSTGTMAKPAAMVAAVLTSCYKPYPPATRAKELQPLLQKWNVPVPPRHRNVSDEDYCRGLVNRLAIKMSIVAQMRMKMNGAGTESGLPRDTAHRPANGAPAARQGARQRA